MLGQRYATRRGEDTGNGNGRHKAPRWHSRQVLAFAALWITGTAIGAIGWASDNGLLAVAASALMGTATATAGWLLYRRIAANQEKIIALEAENAALREKVISLSAGLDFAWAYAEGDGHCGTPGTGWLSAPPAAMPSLPN